MNADDETPLEDQFADAFAAHEAALFGQAADAGPVPEDLRGRLGQDLACAQLLRQVLHADHLDTATLRRDAKTPHEMAAVLPWERLGRFELRQELGRGGFGVVYLAHDPHLNRDVALKVPRAEVALTPELRERFHNEARAAAGLDHPNLVPIYEAGEVGPVSFLVSAYCPGTSLAEWLKQQGEPVPFRLASELAMTLARAVAHAHSRGVFHRDLKPANILLEPLEPRSAIEPAAADDEMGFIPRVTDFGLAKVMETTGIAGAASPTRSGAILGTPAYMAPEQASGKVREVGPAVDVYGIGAILYELLTGRPPFVGESELETVLQVQSQEPVPPARLRPRVPRDLETICLKCLRKEPSRRYLSATTLADDLCRFRDGAPIHARPVSQVEKLLRSCRRRPLVATLVSAVILLLVVGSGLSTALAAWAVQEKDRAEGEQQTAQQERDAATGARGLAEEHLQLANQAVDDYLNKVTEDPELKRQGLHPLRKKLLVSAVPFYQKFVEQKPGDPKQEAARGRAHHRLAFIRAEADEPEQAAADYRRMQAIFQKLADDFPTAAEYRRDLATSHNNLGHLLGVLGRRPEAEAELRVAVTLFQKLADEFPAEPKYRQDLAGGHNNLGRLLRELGRSSEAEGELRAALALFQKLADEFPAVPAYRRDLAVAHFNIGYFFRTLGQRPKAEREYRASRALRQTLADQFPGEPKYREDLAAGHNNLGLVLWEMGRRSDALVEFRASLALHQKLADAFPAVPAHRQALAANHNNLGLILMELRQRPEAEAELRAALVLRQKLADSSPPVPVYRHELATSRANLGLLFNQLGQRRDAETEYRTALAIRQELADSYPAVPEYRQELARVHNNLGILLEELDQRPQAEAQYRIALVLRQKLAGESPNVPDYQSELGGTLNNLAIVLSGRGELVEARQHLERAIDHQHKALQTTPRHPTYRLFLRNHHHLLSDVRLRQGDHAAAVEAVGQLARVRPEVAKDAYDAACFLARAIPLAEKDVKSPEVIRKNLAMSYGDQAVEYLRMAAKKGFRDAEWIKKDKALDPIRTREDFQQLLVELEEKKKSSDK